MRHPEHDRLVKEVRSWYLTSHPKSGYCGEPRRFGYYVRNANNPEFARIVIGELANRDVGEFLADARAYFGDRPINIVVNDAGIDARLGPTLIEAGCSRRSADTYLAHVGPVPQRRGVSGVTIDRAASETLEDYVVTKLKGFAGSEDRPSTVQLAYELALRRGEWQGEGQFLRARLGGETVGISWVLGRSQSTGKYSLATRVPFGGHEGIAPHTLSTRFSPMRMGKDVVRSLSTPTQRILR